MRKFLLIFLTVILEWGGESTKGLFWGTIEIENDE